MAFKEIGIGTLLSPTPVVMVSCAQGDKAPNIITLAWVGTVCSDPAMLSISVRPERYSHDIIRDSGEFAVNLVSRALLKVCDYCGVRSGRDEDKFAACGLHAQKVAQLDAAPAIAESPLYLACKVQQTLSLGTHTLFLANIVGVGANDILFDGTGRLALERADLIAYSHGEYYGLAKREGFFGYSIARPEVYERRMGKRYI